MQIEAKQSGTCHIFFNPWQVVHPLMSTILVPVFALVGLNLRVLSRVPTASTRRSSSRRRCLFSPQMITFVKNHKDHIRICFTLSTKNVPPALAKRGIFLLIIFFGSILLLIEIISMVDIDSIVNLNMIVNLNSIVFST